MGAGGRPRRCRGPRPGLPAAGLRAPSQALALIGWTPEGYAARKVGLAAFGAVFVPLLTAVLGLTGVRLPVVVPVAGSLALAGVLFLVVDLVVRDQAAEARGQMRRALCSYLDLVSLRRDASEGPTIALERAAALGEGWVFRRITDALVAARLAGDPPWDGLRRLAADTGVGELADVADIAVIAAQDGRVDRAHAACPRAVAAGAVAGRGGGGGQHRQREAHRSRRPAVDRLPAAVPLSRPGPSDGHLTR